MSDYPNWFAQTAQFNFEQFLPEFKDKERLKFLQLGAFTGDASVWICENIFSDTFHHMLFDIDTWRGSDEEQHKGMDFNDVYDYYISRVKGRYYVRPYRMSTMTFFTSEKCRFGPYDFIYVDADHTTVGVLLDGEMAWQQLKSGGIMAFDDYTWGHESGDPRLAPMVGIDLFLHRHQGEYELLTKNTQVWIKKK
jgi:hypothetical protein